MCQAVLDYVVVVLGEFLFMMIAFYMFEDKPGRVTTLFEEFQEYFESYSSIFKEVTNKSYKPGNNMKQILKDELREFLTNHDLKALELLFEAKQVTLENVLKMDKNEMQKYGVESMKK